MPAETQPSLGEFLRQEREKRGLTLEQLASETKINVRLLHALESDHYAELPAKPFVRGFVNSYARFLGLDAKEILVQYASYIEEKVLLERPARDEGHSGYAFERKEGEQSRTLLWMVMAIFIIVGGIMLVILKPKLKHNRRPQLEKLRVSRSSEVGAKPEKSMDPNSTAVTGSDALVPLPGSTAPEAKAPATPVVGPSSVSEPNPVPPEPSPAPATPPSSTEDRKPDPLNSGRDLSTSEVQFKVTFKALEDIWVRYKVDEKQMMKFILRKDRTLVLKGIQAIRFQASDFEAVRFSFNGGSWTVGARASQLSKSKNHDTLFFPPQSIKTESAVFVNEAALPKDVPASPGGQKVPSPAPSINPE